MGKYKYNEIFKEIGCFFSLLSVLHKLRRKRVSKYNWSSLDYDSIHFIAVLFDLLIILMENKLNITDHSTIKSNIGK